MRELLRSSSRFQREFEAEIFVSITGNIAWILRKIRDEDPVFIKADGKYIPAS